MTAREWRPVTKTNPCPACGKPDWCAWTREGWLKCERAAIAPPDMVLVRASEGGALFRPATASTRLEHRVPGGTQAVGDRDATRVAARTFSTPDDAIASLGFGAPTRTWEYLNAAGQRVGVVARWSIPNEAKRIRPVALAADGSGWVVGAMPSPRPMLGLPEILTADPALPVFVVEGETCVDAAHRVGLLATTAVGGANAPHQTDWTPLRDRTVVVLPDRDTAGEKYATAVAQACAAAGARTVRIVELWTLWDAMPDHGDIVDVLDIEKGDATAVGCDINYLVTCALADASAAVKPAPVDGAPVLRRLSEVEPEEVAWLWPGRIAFGKVTLIAGDPGLGKSFVTLDIAARVSRGASWPDGASACASAGGVVLLSAEDGIADTIRPRLDAAGADVTRIVALEAVSVVDGNRKNSERLFDLSHDLPALEAAIRSVENCRLVVIDPVTAYLGKTDSHKNAEVRAVLAPLAALAAKHGVAVVVVTHQNKNTGGPAIYRTMGSLAFVAAVRTALLVAKDDEFPARRLFVPIKNNIAADSTGLAYCIRATVQGGTPVVEWEPDPVYMTADEALRCGSGPADESPQRVEAEAWLADYLADGPRSASEITRASEAAGIAKRTLDRAKSRLGIVTTKHGFGGGWSWSLPKDCHDAPEGRHPPNDGILRADLGKNPGPPPKVATRAGSALFGGPGGNLGSSRDGAMA